MIREDSYMYGVNKEWVALWLTREFGKGPIWVNVANIRFYVAVDIVALPT